MRWSGTQNRKKRSQMSQHAISKDIAHFQMAVESHFRNWSIADETLYQLCRDQPRHDRLNSVNAKALFIGRGFASGIERHIKSSGSQGSSIGQLSSYLHDNAAEVDGIIDSLAELQEPLDVQTLAIVAAAHGRLCSLLSQICRNGNVPASFASKYLHFHCPIVPVYDSFARKQAWRMRKKVSLKAFPMPADACDDYYQYLLCFWQVYSALYGLTPNVTVRLVEVYLLSIATDRVDTANSTSELI